jgi:type I site-specific restriction endonuclease
VNEAETRAELVDPALRAAGWGVVEASRVRREQITLGRLQGAGQRARGDVADYVLMYRGQKLAVIEAKKRDAADTEGLGQAKRYAEKLQARFAYSTNGVGIYRVDMASGADGYVDAYPTPVELWNAVFAEQNAWRDRFAAIPFETRGGLWEVRYYQHNAVNNVLEAIVRGEERILLTMATGTGKTAVAFQICWKLFHSRWNLKDWRSGGEPTRRPRILFLADRNILADQAYNNFSAFPEDAMVRIDPEIIRKKGRVPKNGSVFFTIFQTFMASTGSATDSSRPATTVAEPVEAPVEAAPCMYILQCADGSFYTGSTKNLSLRLLQHRDREGGARHTAARLPVELVYYETFERIDEAFRREKQVQGWSRAKKLALIKGNPQRLSELSRNYTDYARPVPELVEGYPPDFFDFVIIDECHRGGANDEGNWRGILEYFSPAVQLGLTATPKRKTNADTYRYFGDPVYIYSLKEGINDGFLTPFKVRQISTTLDEYVYTSDDQLVEGEIEQGKRYVESDFNRVIEIRERERYHVKLFMDAIDQRQKTLVFCATQEHALAVRDLVNQMKTSSDPNYCVRVTANDSEMGEQFLRTFQDNEKTIPTILTTSQKLSTGVDARNVRNIVLMRPINSMIEFKQIIGRGTRLFEGKDYFTIYDFVKAYEHFNDPEWDGEPAEPPMVDDADDDDVDDDGDGDADVDRTDDDDDDDDRRPRPKRIKVKLADGKERTIQHMMATTFWSPDGKPISAAEFIERLFGELPELFKDEEELRRLWSRPDTRSKLLEGLAERGYAGEQLAEVTRLIDAEKSDLYDVLAYIAFALAPIRAHSSTV